jgi:hypothetical protein
MVTSALAVGSQVITANFTGSDGWTNSTGTNSASPQVVNKAGTTTQLTSSGATTVFGQPVTFSARVTANSPGTGVATGSIAFKDGGTDLGTVPLDATGRAVLVTSVLTVGSHSITGSYGGDSNFNGGTSTALGQTVNPHPTTTTLTSSADPATVGQTVTLIATVVANAPVTGIPTGTVTFLDKGKTLGMVTLDAAGKASLPISTLSQGAHQLTASYAGTAGYGSSVSPTLVENIKK